MELHNLMPNTRQQQEEQENRPHRVQATADLHARPQGREITPRLKHKVGFEGGRCLSEKGVPKFGFKNINRVEYKAINLDALEALAAAQNLTKITVSDLRNAYLRSPRTDCEDILATE